MRLLQFMVFTLLSLPLAARPLLSDSTAASPAFGPATELQSFWEMARLGGGIGYIIMGVLGLGLFLVQLKFIGMLLDKKESRELRRLNFPEHSLEKIASLATSKNNSILGNTLAHLLEFYQAGGAATNIHQELVGYIDQENEKFDAYRNWLNFLSDSAGALGLLGTVWGVFLTFFGGSLDSEKILNGMGVALITTLLGLAVSLILNLFNTQLYSAFQRRLEMVSKKADELRLFLLQSEKHSIANAAPPVPVNAGIAAVPSRPAEPVAPQPDNTPDGKPEATAKPLARLQVATINVKELAAGMLHRKAVIVQATNGGEKPLAGTLLHFVTEGPVLLAGKERQGQMKTDSRGQVSIDLAGDGQTGSGRIKFWFSDQPDQPLSIPLQVVPGKPAALSEAGGNDQVGKVKSPLTDSLKVMVTDQSGNPVPDAPILFELTMGDGNFNGGNHRFLARSDDQGIAQSRLTLGDKPGFCAVAARIKDSKSDPVEFRILCKG